MLCINNIIHIILFSNNKKSNNKISLSFEFVFIIITGVQASQYCKKVLLEKMFS